MPLIYEKPETLVPHKENAMTDFYWSSSMLRHRHKEAFQPRLSGATGQLDSKKNVQLFNNKKYSENSEICVSDLHLKKSRFKIIADILKQLVLDLSSLELMPAEVYLISNQREVFGSGVYHYSQNCGLGYGGFTKVNSNSYTDEYKSSNLLLVFTSVYAIEPSGSDRRLPRKAFFDMGVIASHFKKLCKTQSLQVTESLYFYDFELLNALQLNPCLELPIVLFLID